MLDKARHLLAPSARSDVPPFMVMDVMAAAARIEARGGRVMHMEVGQPAAPAPRTARRGREGGARSGRHRLHRGARHPGAARAHRAALCATLTASTVEPERIVVTTGSSAGFILAFLALFEPGDRVAVACPGYPPYRHILTALGCEPVMIEISAGDALGDHRRCAARGASPHAAQGRAGRKPGQSDRHDDAARGAWPS